jgi:hypothetical protein
VRAMLLRFQIDQAKMFPQLHETELQQHGGQAPNCSRLAGAAEEM